MRISDWSSDVCSSDLLQRLLARPLETVAADDGTGAAAVADLLDFLDQALRSLGGAAGEYDESAPVEGGLHHVADACRHARSVHALGLVALTRLFLLDMVGRRLNQIGSASCRERVCQYV